MHVLTSDSALSALNSNVVAISSRRWRGQGGARGGRAGRRPAARAGSRPSAARASAHRRCDAPRRPRAHLQRHLAGHLVALRDAQRVDPAVQQRLRLLQQRARDDLATAAGRSARRMCRDGRSGTAARAPSALPAAHRRSPARWPPPRQLRNARAAPCPAHQPRSRASIHPHRDAGGTVADLVVLAAGQLHQQLADLWWWAGGRAGGRAHGIGRAGLRGGHAGVRLCEVAGRQGRLRQQAGAAPPAACAAPGRARLPLHPPGSPPPSAPGSWRRRWLRGGRGAEPRSARRGGSAARSSLPACRALLLLLDGNMQAAQPSASSRPPPASKRSQPSAPSLHRSLTDDDVAVGPLQQLVHALGAQAGAQHARHRLGRLQGQPCGAAGVAPVSWLARGARRQRRGGSQQALASGGACCVAAASPMSPCWPAARLDVGLDSLNALHPRLLLLLLRSRKERVKDKEAEQAAGERRVGGSGGGGGRRRGRAPRRRSQLAAPVLRSTGGRAPGPMARAARGGGAPAAGLTRSRMKGRPYSSNTTGRPPADMAAAAARAA